jgi:hypothetical protein
MVAHTYNPSYSGGRDQEDCSLIPAHANSSQEPSSKKIPSQKKGDGRVVQGVGLSSSPGTKKKTKESENWEWDVTQVAEHIPGKQKALS